MSAVIFAEEMEDDADALPQALEQFSESARAQVSARAADALLLAAISEITARAEAAILHNKYDRVRFFKSIIIINLPQSTAGLSPVQLHIT